MQNLQFESAWDKTISERDRELIQQVFLKTIISTNKSIALTPLWEAMNHKGELLVTVLVQNFSEQVISFHNQMFQYWEEENIVAAHSFTLPALKIEPATSMPWTFIFPATSLNRQPLLKEGQLKFTESNIKN